MAEALNVALISFSHGHQMDYGRLLAENPQTRLCAVGDVGSASAEARRVAEGFARKHGVPYFADYRAMLDQVPVEAVSVAVQPAENPSVVSACVAHGIHVMCEKPVAADAEGLRLISEAVRKSGVLFTCAIPALFAGPFQAAIDHVVSGGIGEPRVAHFQFIQPRGPQYTLTEEQCRASRRGELANFGPYGFLVFRKMMRQRVVSVFARLGSLFYEHYQAHGVDDLSVLSLTMANGAVGTILVGRSTTQTQTTTDCRMQVLGNDGSVHIRHGLGHGFEVFGPEAARFQTFGRPAGARYVEDFVRCIREGNEPFVNVDDVVDVFNGIEAAYRSRDVGRPVDPQDMMRTS